MDFGRAIREICLTIWLNHKIILSMDFLFQVLREYCTPSCDNELF